MGFPSSNQKRKAYLEEAGGWLEKFHLSFCSPLTGQLQLQGRSWQQVLARLAAA